MSTEYLNSYKCKEHHGIVGEELSLGDNGGPETQP